MKKLITVTLIPFIPALAYAERDLSSAASSAVSQGTTIARALCLLGVMAGAIGYQIPGATNWARATLVGGILGTGIAYGGPSILNLFRGIFGG
jgi:hypothetical protein